MMSMVAEKIINGGSMGFKFTGLLHGSQLCIILCEMRSRDSRIGEDPKCAQDYF